MNDNMYGWFSHKSVEEGHHTCIYRNADGKEFEITSVAEDPNCGPGWDDAVFLGVVGQYVRRGREGRKVKVREFYEELHEDDRRLLKTNTPKYDIKRIMEIFDLKKDLELIPDADDCPKPIIVNMEKTDGSDHVG